MCFFRALERKILRKEKEKEKKAFTFAISVV